MNKVSYLLLIIIAASLLGIWWSRNLRKPTSLAQETQITNAEPPKAKNLSVTPKKEKTNLVLDAADTNSLTAKYRDYLVGKVNKAEMMQSVIAEKNLQNQDFYGKVVDQYSNAVIGAIVTGSVMLDSLASSKEETHITQTDQRGFFQFIGLHGASFGVAASKPGYEWGARGEGYQAPTGEKSSPVDRATLIMWKFRGAEPMKCVSSESRIPADGTSTTFDTATGKENSNGDLQITLLRSPLQVRRSGQKFDWTIKIEMLRGGLKVEDDPYPYWAPENDYQPLFEFNMSSNNVPWRSTMTQNFYIKNSQGQFGRMQLDVYASVTPAGIKVDLWLNQSGSQNLEFDPGKQIQ